MHARATSRRPSQLASFGPVAARAALAATLAAVLATGTAAPVLAASPTGQPTATPSAPVTHSPTPPGGSLAAALAAVRRAGYTPADVSGYDPGRTLSVIVAVLSGSADGHPQRAFFFHDGQPAGNDSTSASAALSWVWSTDDTVAIQYQLYRPSDPMCCPSAGAATVRFRWSGGKVSPLDTVPTTSWSAATGRR